MEYTALLVVHIVGAVVTGCALVLGGAAMVAGKSSAYRLTAIALGSLAAFEVVTGTLLAIFSPTVSVISVCGNIALYLIVVAVVLVPLYIRVRQASLQFPGVQSLSPVGASVAFVFISIALGF